MQKVDFLIVGVGGQGTLLASNVVADVGLNAGYDVKKSEVHGMSQRGGIVESHVRWADKVYSPLTEKGRVDYLLSFELMEGARWAEYLKPDGVAVVNTQRIYPVMAAIGEKEYPSDERIHQSLSRVTSRYYLVDSLAKANELGNIKLVNTVLLGVLSTFMDVPVENWRQALDGRVPKKALEANRLAFQAGREMAESLVAAGAGAR